jgi:hypothetical protein
VKRKALLSIFSWLIAIIALPQPRDSLTIRSDANATSPVQGQKPEIFTNGFIDIINNGQVNASARFIRLFIGEPGKFGIPLSLYSGVSANNFQNQSIPGQISNDNLISAYINPLSGLVNVSCDGLLYFKKTKNVTKPGIIYHFGERVLTGYRSGPVTDPQTGKPCNFLNSFATLGLYFQTAAWERSNAKNVGLFWLVIRYHACYTNPDQVKAFLPDISTNGIYTGNSLGIGVEINNLINLKVIYYRYIKKPEIDYLAPIYQFSFNYSMPLASR